MDKLSALTARRVAIRAHGLSKPRPQGRVDRRHLRKVLDDIGLVQIDSVNVLARSHHLVLYSRLGDHDDSVLTRLADDGSLVEGWVHEASFLPAEHHHLFHWRRDEARRFVGVRPSTRAWVEEHRTLIDDVLEQVRDNGPIGARDLDQRSGRRGPWWGWDEAKIAIEWLFRIGEVGATRGAQFERRYDLMDRVLPEWASREPTDREVAHRELVRLATRHLGVASIGDITDYHRLKKTDVKRHVAELVADGELVEVAVEGWPEPGYLIAHTKPSRTVSQSALVSPFDPLVWHRPRAERLFGFHYRIEIYVPAPERKYGYYVLPFLHNDAIRARVDLKHDRQGDALLCRAAWGEASDDDPADTVRALAQELKELADYIGTDNVKVSRVGDLSGALDAEF